jgi:hypothetical protein
VTADARTLLDVSIANLQTLATLLADELGDCGRPLPALSPEARACKEALLTISVLIPKLHVARAMVPVSALLGRGCSHCDDM